MDSGVAGRPTVLHAGSDADAIREAVETATEPAHAFSSVDGETDAVDALAAGSIACLICESELTDGSGISLLQTVAAERSTVPTLFVTDDDSLIADAIAAGATDVFVRRDGSESDALLSRRAANVLAQSPAGTANTADTDDDTLDLLRGMYEVTTDTESSYEEKLDAILTMGCEALGLTNGFLTRIETDGDGGQQRIVRAHGPHEQLQSGESCPLSEAYCRRTIETDGLLAVSNAPQAGWETDPAYERFELGCYIGGKVVVGDDLYGTVCFAAREPRDRPFTEFERTALRLMSAWVSYELGRQAATAEREMTHRVMNEAPVGILISDASRPDNPAVYVNDQFEAMSGYEQSEVLGRNCRFLQGEATDDAHVRRLREAIDEERPVSVELRNYRKNGTEFWNRVTVAPITDGDGELTHYVGFQEDVTERKNHELDLKLRNRAISAAPIGIAIHDAAGAPWPITDANSAFGRVIGYDSTAVRGSGLSLFEGPETDAERFSTIERAFETGNSAAETVLLCRPDGSPLWARIRIAPVTDGDGAPTHFVSFLEEVTETKEHQQRIERRLDEFGDVLAAELHRPLTDALELLDGNPSDLSADDIATAVATLERTDGLIDDLTEIHSFSVKSREVFDPGRVDFGETS